MIAIFIAIALAFVLLLSAPRLILGPTLYDRVLASVAMCIHAALIAAALAIASGHSEWIDVAFGLIAAVIIFAVSVLKFFRMRTLQAPLAGAGEAG
jgi:multisubunit Na+/H+ antiporter MnhF subunit